MSSGYVDEEKEFWEHVEEMVYRARVALISWLVAMIFVAVAPVSILSWPPSFDLSTNYVTIVSAFIRYVREVAGPSNSTLIAGSWSGSLDLYFNAAALLGLILAFPIISYEIYAFVRPALYPEERSAAIKFTLSFIFLFSIGAAIAFYIVVPVTLRILTYFIDLLGAQPIFFIDDYYNFIFLSVVVVGFVFTFPNWVYILVKIGLIDHTDLVENRKNFVVGVAIATAILTPDPTPFSMLILMIPLLVLYEVSIIVAKKAEYIV